MSASGSAEEKPPSKTRRFATEWIVSKQEVWESDPRLWPIHVTGNLPVSGLETRPKSIPGAMLNAVDCSRIRELQETLAAATISNRDLQRNARVQALQDRWSMLRADLASLKAERAAAMAEAPGDSTGLLIRQYQGAQAPPVYKVDTGQLSLFSELRAHERQVAEELGQWRETAGRRPGHRGTRPTAPSSRRER